MIPQTMIFRFRLPTYYAKRRLTMIVKRLTQLGAHKIDYNVDIDNLCTMIVECYTKDFLKLQAYINKLNELQILR